MLSRGQPASSPTELDPDARLLAMWDRYAPTHGQRIAELERLLAEQHRCWFEDELPRV